MAQPFEKGILRILYRGLCRRMGNEQSSKKQGDVTVEELPPDYYQLLQVSEEATSEEVKVCSCDWTVV
jgi:hypothetical protein